MSVNTFNQNVPQSYRTINDFGSTAPNYNYQIALTQNTPQSFLLTNNNSTMGASSRAVNSYLVKFKPQYGKNVWFDTTGNPTLPGAAFANVSSILLLPGDAFVIPGSTTLYFATPDTGGAYLQASVWLLPI